MEGSYIRVATVFGAIVLVLIIGIEAISACRFLIVEGSDMLVSTANCYEIKIKWRRNLEQSIYFFLCI